MDKQENAKPSAEEQDKLAVTVGKNLTRLRKMANMTQLDLAEKLNYSDKSVSKWEQGTALPSTENLIHLSELYGVPLEILAKSNLSLDQVPEPPAQAKSSKEQGKLRQAIVAIIGLCAILVGIVAFTLLTKDPGGTPIKDLDSDIVEIDSSFDMGP